MNNYDNNNNNNNQEPNKNPENVALNTSGDTVFNIPKDINDRINKGEENLIPKDTIVSNGTMDGEKKTERTTEVEVFDNLVTRYESSLGSMYRDVILNLKEIDFLKMVQKYGTLSINVNGEMIDFVPLKKSRKSNIFSNVKIGYIIKIFQIIFNLETNVTHKEKIKYRGKEPIRVLENVQFINNACAKSGTVNLVCRQLYLDNRETLRENLKQFVVNYETKRTPNIWTSVINSCIAFKVINDVTVFKNWCMLISMSVMMLCTMEDDINAIESGQLIANLIFQFQLENVISTTNQHYIYGNYSDGRRMIIYSNNVIPEDWTSYTGYDATLKDNGLAWTDIGIISWTSTNVLITGSGNEVQDAVHRIGYQLIIKGINFRILCSKVLTVSSEIISINDLRKMLNWWKKDDDISVSVMRKSNGIGLMIPIKEDTIRLREYSKSNKIYITISNDGRMRGGMKGSTTISVSDSLIATIQGPKLESSVTTTKGGDYDTIISQYNWKHVSNYNKFVEELKSKGKYQLQKKEWRDPAFIQVQRTTTNKAINVINGVNTLFPSKLNLPLLSHRPVNVNGVFFSPGGDGVELDANGAITNGIQNRSPRWTYNMKVLRYKQVSNVSYDGMLYTSIDGSVSTNGPRIFISSERSAWNRWGNSQEQFLENPISKATTLNVSVKRFCESIAMWDLRTMRYTDSIKNEVLQSIQVIYPSFFTQVIDPVQVRVISAAGSATNVTANLPWNMAQSQTDVVWGVLAIKLNVMTEAATLLADAQAHQPHLKTYRIIDIAKMTNERFMFFLRCYFDSPQLSVIDAGSRDENNFGNGGNAVPSQWVNNLWFYPKDYNPDELLIFTVTEWRHYHYTSAFQNPAGIAYINGGNAVPAGHQIGLSVPGTSNLFPPRVYANGVLNSQFHIRQLGWEKEYNEAVHMIMDRYMWLYAPPRYNNGNQSYARMSSRLLLSEQSVYDKETVANLGHPRRTRALGWNPIIRYEENEISDMNVLAAIFNGWYVKSTTNVSELIVRISDKGWQHDVFEANRFKALDEFTMQFLLFDRIFINQEICGVQEEWRKIGAVMMWFNRTRRAFAKKMGSQQEFRSLIRPEVKITDANFLLQTDENFPINRLVNTGVSICLVYKTWVMERLDVKDGEVSPVFSSTFRNSFAAATTGVNFNRQLAGVVSIPKDLKIYPGLVGIRWDSARLFNQTRIGNYRVTDDVFRLCRTRTAENGNDVGVLTVNAIWNTQNRSYNECLLIGDQENERNRYVRTHGWPSVSPFKYNVGDNTWDLQLLDIRLRARVAEEISYYRGEEMLTTELVYQNRFQQGPNLWDYESILGTEKMMNESNFLDSGSIDKGEKSGDTASKSGTIILEK